MARNLAAHLRAAYDEALSRFDVLVMPGVAVGGASRPLVETGTTS
jgi:hypothetical protein